MDTSTSGSLRKLFHILFIVALISSLFLRKSVFSCIFMAIVGLFPFIKTHKIVCILYGLTFIMSLILCISQIVVNITYIYRFKTEIDLTNQSEGCNSSYDKYIFEQLGFAWFSCDPLKSILLKVSSDLFVMSISLIALLYNIANPEPTESGTTDSVQYSFQCKIVLIFFDAVSCISVVLVSILNPNITSYIYFYTVISYPIYKSFTYYRSRSFHTTLSYVLTRKLFLMIFYLTSTIYLSTLYLSQFTIIRDYLSRNSTFPQILKLTLFSHINDMDSDFTSVLIVILHLVLAVSLYIILDMRNKNDTLLAHQELQFQSSTQLFHIQLLFQRYSPIFAIIGAFIWAITFNNYISFGILLVAICPTISSPSMLFQVVQLTTLSVIFFTLVILQFVCTFAFSNGYQLVNDNSLFIKIGIFSPGYTPYVLSVKYTVFIFSILGLLPLLKNRKKWKIHESDTTNITTSVCESCAIISDESWLLRPNSIVQIFTYLVTIFSRPIICIVPLIQLYNCHASAHVCVLVCLFLVLSVTQTKKSGWEALQKLGLQITNFYIILWIICCYFFQTFYSVLPGMENSRVQLMLELFDLHDQKIKFILSSYGWLLTGLLVNRFLLSYYSSVLISNRFLASTEQGNFDIPQNVKLIQLPKTMLTILSFFFVKGIKKLVINRRFIIAIACFGVSLVRPSLLTFLSFFFSCLFATTHHRRFNQFVSTILMLLAVIIVIVMTVYQNSHVPTVVLNPSFVAYHGNDSLIATGLTRNNAFQPILAFLFVIFMFSFFNSLSRYYSVSTNSDDSDLNLNSISSFTTHTFSYFFTYFGYELVILSAIISAIQHSDIGSTISIFFVTFLLFLCPDLCRISRTKKQYIIYFLNAYKYFLVLLIMIRFALHVSCSFMTLWINQNIKDTHYLSIIDNLFIKRTIDSNNRFNLIFDYIHLFLLRVYTRDLSKNRLINLNKRVLISDFSSCRNSFEFIYYCVYYHFIRLLFVVSFLVPFNSICFANVIYMIVSGFIIVFENKIYYSIRFKNFIKSSIFFPIFVILLKLTFQLTSCLASPMYKVDNILTGMLFNTYCPNPVLLNIYSSIPDLIVLIVILFQIKIFHSKEYNYTIINHYLYHLEAYNISAIATRESELCRLDYERKLRAKQDKIKKSIEAIKQNISYDCGIPIPDRKIDSLYGVTQTVFEKFYSHKDGQNKIFDDYNSKDVDDYIDDMSTPVSPVITPVDPATSETDTPKSSFKEKLKTYFGWMSGIFCLVERFKKKVRKMYHKESERQTKISSIIDIGRRLHFDELNRLVSTLCPEFEYKIESNPNSSDDEVLQEPKKVNRYISFIQILFGTIMHYLIRHTDFLVFIAIVIHQIYTSSFGSMFVIISYFSYAAISVPRPSSMYWRMISLFVLFSSFARYITSITPLNHIFTCSYSKCTNINRIEKHGSLCVYQIFGLDGCDFSPLPDLLVLLFIQIHLASLHYRGMVSGTLKPNIAPISTPPEGFMAKFKTFIKDFMRKYEKSICTMEHDYYSVIFLTQAGQWIIIAFYWNSFLGSSKLFGDITQIIKGSVIPLSFSILITLQSLFMLIDRFININRKRFYKLVYTIILVILVHIFIFFIVPYKTQQAVSENIPICVFYILYCLYFYFSFIPVRNGYSSKHVLPYSITRYHNYYSIVIVYCIIYFPFIYEIDTVLRWFSSSTALGFFQYIKIDEIFFNMHNCKSFRRMMDRSNEASGNPYYFPLKLLLTLLSLGIFFLAMILPLWIYSTGVSSTKSVLPSQIDISVSINGYYPLFESSIIRNKFSTIKEYKDIVKVAEDLDSANLFKAKSTLLDYIEVGDIIFVEFPEPSLSSWAFSYPSKQMLLKDIQDDLSKISFRIRFKIHRESFDIMHVFGSEKIEGSFIEKFNYNITMESEYKQQLIDAITQVNKSVFLPSFIKNTIRVEPSKPIHYFQQITKYHLKNVCACHKSHVDPIGSYTNEWWEFKVAKEDSSLGDCVNNTSTEKIGIYFFIDFLKSSYIDIFSPSKNAIALYIILITSVSTFLKKFFLNTSHLIMYQEVPNPDYILNLCRYIYRSRWSCDLELEEFFISILFFIYRSPETLIRVTKRPTPTTDTPTIVV